ncbi:MAG TPA: hypothetical protein VLW85_24485 [Myxococcales bacterium]|nr:hypothetical protein [Myxococcales bacterium]
MELALKARAVLNFRGTLDEGAADEIIAAVAMMPAQASIVIDLHDAVPIERSALARLARSLTMAGRAVRFEGLPHDEGATGQLLPALLLN